MVFQRVAILGHSCAGKTTLAKRLAHHFHLPHLELDSVYWQRNWTPLDLTEFRDRVGSFTEGPSWVIDGNYSRVQDLIVDRATTIVWLDYPLPLILARVFARSLRRAALQEVLWNDNRETLRHSLWGKDGLPLWVLRTDRKKSDRYVRMQAQGAVDANWVRLRSPRELHAWLDECGLG